MSVKNDQRTRSTAARPRQADIARAANVSQATVSLVLNSKAEAAGLAMETVRRVREAADQLRYVADPVAVRLVGRRNRLLGVYTFAATFPVDVRDSYYPFLAGVEERAAQRGYDLMLFTGSSGTTAPEQALDRVRMSDGCVLFGREAPIEMIERLLDDGYPIVYIGRRDELGTRIPYIGADYAEASAEVVRRLTGLGHRRMCYLREPDTEPSTEDRASGVRAGGLRRAVPVHGRIEPDWLRARTSEGTSAFIVQTVELYDALRTALRAAGLRCPQDVSIAMLGDRVDQPSDAPVVSGFALPRRDMGRQAAELLIDLLDEGDGADERPIHHQHGRRPQNHRQRLLPCDPIPGDTVAARSVS